MSRLIDADALKKSVEGLTDCYNGFSDTYDKACIIGLIDEEPSVDAVKVKHGHWEETPIPIWLRNNTTRTYYFKCNKCSSTSWNRDNYCSHCGAKMDEVTE